MRRLWGFGLVNLFAMCFTCAYALVKRNNFYAASVYITHSSFSMLILLSMVFYCMFLAAYGVQFILFGSLRAIEIEHIWENSYFTISEIFLAMTIFREEFNITFGFAFAILLITKIFHWLLKERIDYLEQTMNTNRFFLSRLVITAACLLAIDFKSVVTAVSKVKTAGHSIMILFGTEYAILLVYLLHNVVKLVFNLIDISDPIVPWDEKSTYVFYLEMITDFIKLSIYLGFFVMVTRYYGLPIHIVRDLYFTIKSFAGRVRDLIRYKRAVTNLETKYPDATREEIEATDKICIICRDEMTIAKKLPCGHIFHLSCLKSWIERQQSCPTCRRQIFEEEKPPSIPSPVQQPVDAAAIGHPNNNGLVNNDHTNNESPHSKLSHNTNPTNIQSAADADDSLRPLLNAQLPPLVNQSVQLTPPPPPAALHAGLHQLSHGNYLPIVLLPQGDIGIWKGNANFVHSSTSSSSCGTMMTNENEFIQKTETQLCSLLNEIRQYKSRLELEKIQTKESLCSSSSSSSSSSTLLYPTVPSASGDMADSSEQFVAEEESQKDSN